MAMPRMIGSTTKRSSSAVPWLTATTSPWAAARTAAGSVDLERWAQSQRGQATRVFDLVDLALREALGEDGLGVGRGNRPPVPEPAGPLDERQDDGRNAAHRYDRRDQL